MGMNSTLEQNLQDLLEPKTETALLAVLSNPNSLIFNKEMAERALREENAALDMEAAQLFECLIQCREASEQRFELQQQLEAAAQEQKEAYELVADEEDELDFDVEARALEEQELVQEMEGLQTEMGELTQRQDAFEYDWSKLQHRRADVVVDKAEKAGLFTSEAQKEKLREMLAEQPSPLLIMQANPALRDKPDIAKDMCIRGGVKNELALHACCAEEKTGSVGLAILASLRKNKKAVAGVMKAVPQAISVAVVEEAVVISRAIENVAHAIEGVKEKLDGLSSRPSLSR